jgi:predicted DNA-binding ArsR family transcriptional regulator
MVSESDAQELFGVLDDADCRAILGATSDDALTANEVSETCDLPLSTAYRKLALLVKTDLLEERTRVRRTGKHASEYARLVEDIVISFDSRGGIDVRVLRRGAAKRSESTPPVPGD